MHRPAASPATAIRFAKHLRQQRAHRHATCESMTMFEISGDNPIVSPQRLHCANGDRLFTDVEMKKTANLAEAIELYTFFFEASDAEHLAQQRQQMLSNQPWAFGLNHCAHLVGSKVEISPSGRPISRAL